jgi:hypothetical protein
VVLTREGSVMNLRSSFVSSAPFRRSVMALGLMLAAAVALAPRAGLAQPEAGGVVITDARAEPGLAAPVNPVRPTFPDNAWILEPGVLQVETGYPVAFYEDPVPTLHVWDVYAALGVGELIEVRVGWDILNAAAGEAGVGDLTLGAKGGFWGGFDERTALAGVFALQLPTARAPFGLRQGVRLVGGPVATTEVGPVQLDVQVTADLHLFAEDPAFLIPLAAAATWAPIDRVRVYGDAVVALDLENFSDSRTSVLAGAGYRAFRTFEVNAAARLGLSPTTPDVVLQLGLAWQVADFW